MMLSTLLTLASLIAAKNVVAVPQASPYGTAAKPTPFITLVLYGDTDAQCGDQDSAKVVDIIDTECFPLEGRYLSVKGRSNDSSVTYNSLHVYKAANCNSGWMLEPLYLNRCSDFKGLRSIRFRPGGWEEPDDTTPHTLMGHWPREHEVPSPMAFTNTPAGRCKKDWCNIGRFLFCCDPKNADSSKEAADDLTKDVSPGIITIDENTITGLANAPAKKCKKDWCNIGRFLFCCDPKNTETSTDVTEEILTLVETSEAPAEVARDITPLVEVLGQDALAGITGTLAGRCGKDWCNIGRFLFCCDTTEKDLNATEIAEEVSALIEASGHDAQAAGDISTGTADLADTNDSVKRCKKDWCNIGRFIFCCDPKNANDSLAKVSVFR